MKLKKTTVLTGNHAPKQEKRDRARSDNDFHNMFKNDLQSHAASINNNTSGEKKEQNESNKVYLPKGVSKNALEVHPEMNEYIAYRKKSHAV